MITIQQINQLTAAHFNVTPEKLYKKYSGWEIVYMRQIAMALCRRYNMTNKSIGIHFGFDHTTVLHSVRVVKDAILCNREPLLTAYSRLTKQCDEINDMELMVKRDEVKDVKKMQAENAGLTERLFKKELQLIKAEDKISEQAREIRELKHEIIRLNSLSQQKKFERPKAVYSNTTPYGIAKTA